LKECVTSMYGSEFLFTWISFWDIYTNSINWDTSTIFHICQIRFSYLFS
jgi:hypothetical protein